MKASSRVALITGCGKQNGIGGATARALAAAGVIAVVSDLQAKGVPNAEDLPSDFDPSWNGLESHVSQITAAGGTASWVQCDVTSEDSVANAVDEVMKRYGRVDILVNNAGAPHGRDRGEIQDVPLDAWEKMFNIHCRGTFLMSRAVIPHMRKERWGRIISMSSANAKRGKKMRTAYAASKTAIVGFTRALAIEVAPYGITVNALCPGPIRTASLASSARRAASGDTAGGLEARLARIPVGREGRPEEVAALIAFLCSDIAGFITAQPISICGGTT